MSLRCADCLRSREKNFATNYLSNQQKQFDLVLGKGFYSKKTKNTMKNFEIIVFLIVNVGADQINFLTTLW